MQPTYAPDDLVFKLMSGEGRRLSAAHYIYAKSEAEDKFFAAMHECGWIVNTLPEILNIEAKIYYAVVASKTPFQVCHVGDGRFVILVDSRAFSYLLTLCLRLQSLPPLCADLGVQDIPESRDYRGKFLLDITKDIVFRTEDVSYLLVQTEVRMVYQAALIYIIGHEVAHISHGHIEFQSSPAFADFCLNEYDKALTLRTLEMDADSSATSSVVDIFERYLECLSDVGRLQPSELEQAKRLTRYRYVAGIFISHLYHDSLAGVDCPSITHPIGYARFLTSVGVLDNIGRRNMPAELALIPETVRRALVASFIKVSGALENLAHPIASNVIVWDGEAEERRYEDLGALIAQESYLYPLLGRWSRIRPFLERFQRGGVLAPATALPY